MPHERFHYQTVAELQAAFKALGVTLPVSEDTAVLGQSLTLAGGKVIPNRLAVQPMEGCDGTTAGQPDELTYRRYERFARGGAGLLWFEATAVAPEGRANPRQLHINQANLAAFQRLTAQTQAAAQQECGSQHHPFTVLQLTHSGRYSKPTGQPQPIVACVNPYLDKAGQQARVITDEELARLEDAYVDAATLAAAAGFDAVDIKSCHGYLLGELLGAHNRPGIYGGSFANRTRFLCNVVDKIHHRLGERLVLAVRLNAYDAVPYPYGWGVDRRDFHPPDFTEPGQLARILQQKGVQIIDVSVGNPYYNPHVGRPYDLGPYLPPVHPLANLAVLLDAARHVQQAAPAVAVIATGFTWLRHLAPYVAAGCVRDGWSKLAGFGRQAFAYPAFARDILAHGALEPRKVCVTCSKCTVIMRDGGRTGCVVRDAATYGPIYRAGRDGKAPAESMAVAEHL